MNEEKAISSHFKCGRVALLGRPNAGKSTLLNELMGSPMSATSNRPQTTRSNIKGILQQYDEDKKWSSQLILLDTPGVDFKKGLLERSLMQSVEHAFSEVDVGVWLADCRKWKADLKAVENDRVDEDRIPQWLKQRLESSQKGQPWILLLTKVDLISKGELLPLIEKTQEIFPEFSDIIPISSVEGFKSEKSNLKVFLEVAKRFLPEKEPEFPEDSWTDQREKDLVKNLIMECIFNQCKKEVPYLTDCSILSFEEAPEKHMRRVVHAVLWVSRPSLKRILVGAKGQMIKSIGSVSRKKYQEITGEEIILKLFVKVVDRWEKRVTSIEELGYGINTI